MSHIIKESTFNAETGRKETGPIVRCDCGREFECGGFTTTCETCGADYNWNGQRLAPREQWGEETGETAADILGPDPEEEGTICPADGQVCTQGCVQGCARDQPDDPSLQDEWYSAPHTHGVSAEDY